MAPAHRITTKVVIPAWVRPASPTMAGCGKSLANPSTYTSLNVPESGRRVTVRWGELGEPWPLALNVENRMAIDTVPITTTARGKRQRAHRGLSKAVTAVDAF